jgi:hypothetical protein
MKFNEEGAKACKKERFLYMNIIYTPTSILRNEVKMVK